METSPENPGHRVTIERPSYIIKHVQREELEVIRQLDLLKYTLEVVMRLKSEALNNSQLALLRSSGGPERTYHSNSEQHGEMEVGEILN